MRSTASSYVTEQLQSARDLLGQGQAGQAQLIVDAVLEYRARFSREDLVRSCGLQARLLALRGEQIRARMMAELAVQLACDGVHGLCRADAYLDQVSTRRALGDRGEALACLRRARELPPLDTSA